MRRLLDFKLLITGLILGHFTLGTVSCDKDNDDPEPKDNTEQEKGGEEPTSKKDSVDNGGTTKDDALKYTEAQLKAANTAEDASYLSKEEKLVVYYMNLARMDGKMFIETYLKDLKTSMFNHWKLLKLIKVNIAEVFLSPRMCLKRKLMS